MARAHPRRRAPQARPTFVWAWTRRSGRCSRRAGSASRRPSSPRQRTDRRLPRLGGRDRADRAQRRARTPIRSDTSSSRRTHAACVGTGRGRRGDHRRHGHGGLGRSRWAAPSRRRVGLPRSDEGSGAWLGCELARRMFWAYDGRVPWTGLLTAAFERFGCDPHAIVRWMGSAKPRDFAELAPSSCTRGPRRPRRVRADAVRGRHVDGLAERTPRDRRNGSRWPADCRRASSPGSARRRSVGWFQRRRCTRRCPVARSSGSRVRTLRP